MAVYLVTRGLAHGIPALVGGVTEGAAGQMGGQERRKLFLPSFPPTWLLCLGEKRRHGSFSRAQFSSGG